MKHVSGNSVDWRQEPRRQPCDGRAIPDFGIKADRGLAEDEASTQLPSSDSDSQEASAQVPSSDSDSQRAVSAQVPGGDGGSQDTSTQAPRSGSGSQMEVKRSPTQSLQAEVQCVAEGLSPGPPAEAHHGRKSPSSKSAPRSSPKRSASRRARRGGGTILAAGLAPVAPQCLAQTALLAGLTFDDACSPPKPTARARRPGSRRSPKRAGSRGAGAGSCALEPGKYVQIPSMPAQTCLGKVLVVDHAQGRYKVRMLGGGVCWLKADKVGALL